MENNILDVVNALDWKFAKTMQSIPHWYTVRQENDEEKEKLYVELYKYIENNYKIEYFYKKPYKYSYIGEYKYWFMGPLYQSKIINRTKVEK